MATDFLLDAAARHAHWVEQYKNRQVKKLVKSLQVTERTILEAVGYSGLNSLKDVRDAQAEIGIILIEGLDTLTEDLTEELKSFGVAQAEFEAATIAKGVAEAVALSVPTESQLWAAAKARPFDSKMLKETLDEFSESAKKLIKAQVRTAFYEGYTLDELVVSLAGSKQMGFRDGVFGNLERSLKRTVRTSVSHMASVARDKVYNDNSDVIVGVEWVSVLDGRTSAICRSYDGQVFPVDSGPRPPVHPNACLAGTMIETTRGAVAIEHVKVGDYVKTHTGLYKRVYTVMAREYSGGAVTLKDNFGSCVSLTNEHPVLTANKGWVEAVDVNAGDVLFYNFEQLNGLDSVGVPSLVPQGLLLDSHNMETSLTDELVSYGIFSSSVGMTASVQLDGYVTNDKVGVVSQDSTLSAIDDIETVKNACKQSFMLGGVFSKLYSESFPAFYNRVFVKRWVKFCHSFRRFSAAFGMQIRVCFAPMIVPFRNTTEFHVINDRLLPSFSDNSVPDARFAQRVIAEPEFSFNPAKALAQQEMLGHDDFFECDDVHKDLYWLASTCIESVGYHHNGYVYNLAVEEDETYLADGFVVHNCRSTTVAVIDKKFKIIRDEDAFRPAKGASGREEAKATDTYGTWLKRQPAGFQDDILGKDKGKLFRQGGLPMERFVDNGKELTLDELKKKYPKAWEKSNL